MTGFRAGKPRAPDTVEDFRYYPGVPEALLTLKNAGYLLIVVTNQPDVARGWQKRELVDAIHAKLRAELPVDAIYACFHDAPVVCTCRKPAPGMLLEGAAAFSVDPALSYMIGDRETDIEAGKRAGCRTIRILENSEIENPKPEAEPTRADSTHPNLISAARWILSHKSAPSGS